MTYNRFQKLDLSNEVIWILGFTLFSLLLYLSSLYSYILFHSLVEILKIVLAWSIFLAAWNSRHMMTNHYLFFLGIAYLFTGSIDTIHMLSYKGMGIFQGYGANLPTQLWIGARLIEGFSFLIAPIFIKRKVKTYLAFTLFTIILFFLIISIFYWQTFPACYVEGVGLTSFKIACEYLIILILITAGMLLYHKRTNFEKDQLRTLMFAIAISITAELAFTQYISVYGWVNLVGHLIKCVSIYLIYRVIVQAGLISPYSQLFMDLKRSRDDFELQASDLEERVKELNCLFGISKLREKRNVSLNQTLQDVVELIPSAWRYSKIACARIILDGFEYRTNNFRETIWKQASQIFVNNVIAGSVEVFYLEERSESHEGPFLKSERTLINALGERLGNIIQHEKSKEALNWELKINSALSELYKPLVSSESSIEDISDSILEKALDVTRSDRGFVSSIDPVTGDNVVHTFTEMLKGECRVSEEKRKVSFPRDKNGQFPNLWGHALNTKEAFYTNAPETHKASNGIPEGHIPIKRFLSFPVTIGQELAGQIGLANKPEDYTDRDLKAISRFAEYFALAIQRRTVEDSLKKARDELEIRVNERTAQLLATNFELQKEIEEHKLAEDSLIESETERKKLSARLFEAYEEENRRIGRELHDGLAQSLSAIRIWGENALMQLNMGDSKETLSNTLNSLIRLARGTIEEIRRIVRNMRPSILDDLGIVTTISWLCKEFEAVYPDIKIFREIDIDEEEVPETLKIIIFRILQEALNNVAKHSRANNVTVGLENIKGKIELCIEDDGIGFDITDDLLENKYGRGIGLANMQRRSELSGGIFYIKSFKDKGSTIRVTWSHDELIKLSA